MPFLLRLDIRRQDEGWAPATYISIQNKTYDLTVEFAHVTEADVTSIAKQRWTSPTVDIDKHTVGHDTCHARLLAKCLMASISSDLILILLNHIPSKYRNDGTYVLWTITNNIYRNNVAFVESIREKIYTATITHHNNDVEKYLVYIKNNLRMITSSSPSKRTHNGLITYILRQLKHHTNAPFLRYIQDLHIDYQEGKLPKYTPLKLIQAVEDKIRVLKHAEVWDSVGTSETPAMALNSTMTISDQLKEFLANHISTELKKLNDKDSAGKDGKSRHRFQHQDWMFIGPSNPSDMKTVNGRNYNWRAKCNRGNGQWVQSHTTDSHQDGFRLPPHRQDASKKGTNTKRVHFGATQDGTLKNKSLSTLGDDPTKQPNAQLSLVDGVSNCFRFDVTDLEEND
jgi:hypothetical protein